MKLTVLDDTLAVCQLGSSAPVPAWVKTGDFLSITRTRDELSIVCSEGSVPPDVKAERQWRALKVLGPLDFSLTGILSSISAPLASEKISLFAVSTFDTDYILVRENDLTRATRALQKAGFIFV